MVILYLRTKAHRKGRDLFCPVFFCHLLQPQLLKLIRCGLHERHVTIPTTASKMYTVEKSLSNFVFKNVIHFLDSITNKSA